MVKKLATLFQELVDAFVLEVGQIGIGLDGVPKIILVRIVRNGAES